MNKQIIEKDYIVVQTSDDFDKMIIHIKESELLAYDTETTGLNVRQDKVIGFAVCGEIGKGFYYPISKWNGEFLEQIGCETEINELFEEIKKKKLIMHNASYDVRITKHSLGHDLLPSLYADSMILKHTTDEDYPFGLKDIAKKIQKHIGLNVKESANKEQEDMIESIKAAGGQVTKEKYELFKADMMKIGIYAISDVDLTMRVFNYYSSKLEEEGLVNFFYKDEVMPLLREVTIPMEDRGIPVDVELLKDAQIEINKDIAKIEQELQTYIKPYLGKVFEPWFLNKILPPKRSGSFAQYLCRYADLALPKTKAGRYSITEANVLALEPSSFRDFLLNNGDKSEDTFLPEEVVLDIQKLAWADSDEGNYMFNLSSKDHLAKLFFNTLNEESVTKTPTGRPQMNDYFLQSIKDKYEFVPLLLDYNKLTKLKSAYIDNILGKQEEGIFYPSFMQHRTISGRYGSNLQQLPRPIEEGKASEVVIRHNNKVRKFFISGNDCVFIDNDYESLEPHVFAHVSGDENLKNIFRNGDDFYSIIAIGSENIEGVSANKKADNYLGKIDKSRRDKAKSYSLGIPYGMEDFLLSKTLNCSKEEASNIIKGYSEFAPTLWKWMEESERQAKFNGKVRSEAGRIRHLDAVRRTYFAFKDFLFNSKGDLKDSLTLWKEYHKHPADYAKFKEKRKAYKNLINNAKNFQIQSLAASIVNRAAIKINRELERQGINGYVCAQIHDQLIVRVPKSKAEHCRQMVQYIMENNYKISISLKAPAEIGTNFYEAH